MYYFINLKDVSQDFYTLHFFHIPCLTTMETFLCDFNVKFNYAMTSDYNEINKNHLLSIGNTCFEFCQFKAQGTVDIEKH